MEWQSNPRDSFANYGMVNYKTFIIWDPYVFLPSRPDPALDPFIIKQNSKKNLDSYCFVTSL
jgi:hypothetical protein